MKTTREKFNDFFDTNIKEDDWNENSAFVCDEYESSDEFEENVECDFDELVHANTAAYDGENQVYIFFNECNYDWKNEKIITWN